MYINFHTLDNCIFLAINVAIGDTLIQKWISTQNPTQKNKNVLQARKYCKYVQRKWVRIKIIADSPKDPESMSREVRFGEIYTVQ